MFIICSTNSSPPKRFLLGIAYILALFALFSASAQDAGFGDYTSDDSSDYLRPETTSPWLDSGHSIADSVAMASEILAEAFLSLHKLYIDSLSVKELLSAAFDGLHNNLDPYTKYLSPAEFDRLISPSSARAGLGIVCDFSHSMPRIRKTLADGPAELGGLRPGDRIVSIGSHSLEGIDSTNVKKMLRGAAGSTVALGIESPGQVKRLVSLPRALVGEQMVEGMLIHGGTIGYLRIKRFARGVSAECERILNDWQSLQLTGVIIDLRDNPGGFLDEAVLAADLFLPIGTPIVVSKGRALEESSVEISISEPVSADLPLTILVDSMTASSAEVFAGALRGAKVASLLGETTYGKRTVQRVRRLPGGSAIKMTSARFQTPADIAYDLVSHREIDISDMAGLGGQRQGTAEQGDRLRPDRHLPRPVLASPWNWVYSAGLLSRFMEGDSVTDADFNRLEYWNQITPEIGNSISLADDLAPAPGFNLWQARLEKQLSRWGVVVNETPRSEQGWFPTGRGLENGFLRNLWLIDWADEFWGEAMAARAQVELDPWVESGCDEIIYRSNGRGTQAELIR